MLKEKGTPPQFMILFMAPKIQRIEQNTWATLTGIDPTLVQFWHERWVSIEPALCCYGVFLAGSQKIRYIDPMLG